MSDSEPPSDSSLVIREMTARDTRSFIELRKEIDRESPYMPSAPGERRESLLYNLAKFYWNRRRVTTFLAFDNGELVGYIILLVGRFSKFRGNAYIANVSVKSKYRGRGIGTKLMARAEECARERRARRVELEVFAKNESAWKLYEHLGYDIEGRKRKAIESKDGYDDLIMMAKFI